MKIDYGKKSNWLACPKALKKVDTFFLYPSSYISPKEEFRPFADIRDENMVRIANICLNIQGGVFEQDTNVFAPLYRQVDPEYGFQMIKEGKEHLLEKVILADVQESFSYYINNLNNGRPFILAGHSQGSTLLMRILSGYLGKHKNVLRNMVAAYMIGYSITDEYLKSNSHLKFVTGEKDTGVIISWNTQMPNLKEKNPILQDKSKVINPLNWRLDDTYASKSINLGSLINGELIVPGVADAKINIDKGVLECGNVNPREFKQSLEAFPIGSYHSMDYGFYFENIKANVKTRIKAFFEKQGDFNNEFKRNI